MPTPRRGDDVLGAPSILDRTEPALDRPRLITPEWAYGDRTGAGVRVAVIDSGIEGGHPLVGEIAQSVVVELDRDSEDGYRVRADEDRDLHGHGTACAGIIRGLAPGVELHSVRVLGERLTGRARCFAGALGWAIESGMQVVNLSLSTTNEEWYGSFMDLADRARRHRVMLVGALPTEP
jgi:subtilisin family serine protease